VRIALALKLTDYSYVAVDLSALVGNVDVELPSEYREVNKMAQLPTLEVTDDANGSRLVLTQSLPIMEYLDETIAGVPLVGTDALTRMRVREISEIINSGTQPLQNLSVLRMVKEFEKTSLPPQFAEEEIANTGKGFAKFAILKGLAAVESKLEEYNSTLYCVGDAVTMADICLVPQMYNARRFMIDVEKYFPRCVAVDAHVATLDAFKAAHADACSDAKK
jgi:maleylpyruvate isomerase